MVSIHPLTLSVTNSILLSIYAKFFILRPEFDDRQMWEHNQACHEQCELQTSIYIMFMRLHQPDKISLYEITYLGENQSSYQERESQKSPYRPQSKGQPIYFTTLFIRLKLPVMTKTWGWWVCFTYRQNEMMPSRVMKGRAEILQSSHFSSNLLMLHDNMLSQIMIITFTAIPTIPIYKGILKNQVKRLHYVSAKTHHPKQCRNCTETTSNQSTLSKPPKRNVLANPQDLKKAVTR